MVLVLACNPSDPTATESAADPTTAPPGTTTGAPTTGAAPTTGGPGTPDGTAEASVGSEDSSGGGTKFDMAVPDMGMVEVPTCRVTDLDAVGPCVDKAPADSFSPVVEWTWVGIAGEDKSVTVPLVANLTDDDANGAVDLCDTPDVVMLAWTHYVDTPGHLYVIDGKTGTTHFRVEHPIFPRVHPALGDIDADGLPEIVAVDMNGSMVAFEHDGALKWASPPLGTLFQMFELAVAVADLQGDGAPELLLGRWVVDSAGAPLLTLDDEVNPFDFISGLAVTAADLDGDDDLEVVMGRSAWHHDGSLFYKRGELQPGYPQVADLDDDPDPEVLLMHGAGPTILEHDGTPKILGTNFNDSRKWSRPAAVHSFFGGQTGFIASNGMNLTEYTAAAVPVWTMPVSDWSGLSGSTAFDFLGDGTAEAVYSDETQMFTFDGMTGAVLQTGVRTSWTGIEYPVVADVDNDGEVV
jgi:hypothetical protein